MVSVDLVSLSLLQGGFVTHSGVHWRIMCGHNEVNVCVSNKECP